jgi:hypothetical protein
MHNAGYAGQGIVIAQLDAGFYHVNQHPAFDSLYAHNQILGNKDFLHNGMPFFDDPNDVHGMWVLSIMGGNLPGHLIGAAPKASFWMLRTEEIYHEYQCEEYNWVSGAEFADSVGADVITSSLGYTVFDSLFPSHTCADMNGHTTVASKGANTAWSALVMKEITHHGTVSAHLEMPMMPWQLPQWMEMESGQASALWEWIRTEESNQTLQRWDQGQSLRTLRVLLLMEAGLHFRRLSSRGCVHAFSRPPPMLQAQ